jgi:hypothetical protein
VFAWRAGREGGRLIEVEAQPCDSKRSMKERVRGRWFERESERKVREGERERERE